jgi:hypothetical protein
MASYFVIDRILGVLTEKLKKVLPKNICSDVLENLCVPVETAPVRSLKEITLFLYQSKNIRNINFESNKIKELAEQHAWIDHHYTVNPIRALKNIVSKITDPEYELKKLEMERKNVLLKNRKIADKLKRMFPDDHIVWSWISAVRELIKLDNDDHKFLAMGFYKCKPLFRNLSRKLNVRGKIVWLNPQSIFTYLEKENTDLEKIANRRMKEGYVLILDGKELHEFSTLSEAQRLYNLPEPRHPYY